MQKQIFYSPRSKTTRASAHQTITLSDALKGFELACKARRLSKHTLVDYFRTLRRFLVHVGDTPIDQITTTQVSAFLAAQPYGEKTILNYHIGLSALWTWLIREGYTDKHLLHQVEKPKPKLLSIQPFTEADVKAMINCVRRNNERDKSVILLLLDTGLRASELTGIELSQLDLVNRRVKVLGKGNKERILPFSVRTSAALFLYISTLETSTGKLYPYSRNSLADLIADIGKRAGIKKAHPHRFRHTFAITYLRNGGDPYTLQAILGHSTMEMLKRYLALAQIDIDEAHKRASPVEGWQL
jgi:site-specific recombinase XerD